MADYLFLPHCIIVFGNFNSVMIGQLGGFRTVFLSREF